MEFTESELLIKVSTFYNAPLDIEKAKAIYEITFGIAPTIVDKELIVSFEDNFNSLKDAGSVDDDIYYEHLKFTKELQESGATNMFIARPYIENGCDVSNEHAGRILKCFMEKYENIFLPEDLL